MVPLTTLHGGSREITVTVPLRCKSYLLMECFFKRVFYNLLEEFKMSAEKL